MRHLGLNILFLCVALLVGGSLLTSCEERNAIVETPGSGGMSVVEEVVLDGVTNQTVNIRASVKPTLTCDAEWLKIGEVKNLTTGIYTVEFTAEVNGTGLTRTATVTVTAGKETATVTVTQLFSDIVEIKSLDPEGGILDPNGGTLTVRYTATGTPATNLPEWMSLPGSRALEEGELVVTYLANNTGRERTGMIVLAVGKGAVANVTVSQSAR